MSAVRLYFPNLKLLNFRVFYFQIHHARVYSEAQRLVPGYPDRDKYVAIT